MLAGIAARCQRCRVGARAGARGYHRCKDSIFRGLFCVIVDWRNSVLSTCIITGKVKGVFLRWLARGFSRHDPSMRGPGHASAWSARCGMRARVAPGWAESWFVAAL